MASGEVSIDAGAADIVEGADTNADTIGSPPVADENGLLLTLGSLDMSETSVEDRMNIMTSPSFEHDSGDNVPGALSIDEMDNSPVRHQTSLEIDTGEMDAPPVKDKDERMRESSSTLYNFLVLHHLNVLSDPQLLFDFEALTLKVLEFDMDEHSPLKLLLVEHGWNGAKYKHSPSIAFDVHKLTQDLGTMYFVGKSTELLKRELSLDKDSLELYNECSLLQTFCPNIVIRNILASFDPANRVDVVDKEEDVEQHQDEDEDEDEEVEAPIKLYRQVPACCSFFAACMLADISGFTKLSSAYCSKGSAGLDALHHVTETFLGDLVKTVYNFNGDVISFAGDALVCVFYDSNPVSSGTESDSTCPRERKSQRNCCSRALRCALQLAALETPELTTHIAISCGEMKIANLGGFNHEWVYLLNGPCMSALGNCVDEAKSRQVVVTKDVLNLAIARAPVPEDADSVSAGSSPPRFPALNVSVEVSTPCGLDVTCTYDNTASGNAKVSAFTEKPTARTPSSVNRRQNMLKIDSAQSLLVSRRHNVKNMFDEDELDFIHSLDNMSRVEEAQDVILQFVPKPAAEAILCGYFELISELRQVTTLFLKLDSYSPELHLDPLCFQDLFWDIQEILAETGGFMRQFLVDDKGCVLIAMWGIPHYTFSNNSSRAICGAQMIQEACTEHGHHCSIGITTGTVFCGTVGSSIRRDYVAIGHTVNLAARLMCKAQGRIFVDDTTYSLLPSVAKRRLLRSDISLVLKGVDGVLLPYIVQTQAELMSQSNADGMELLEFETIIQLSIVDHDRSTNSQFRDIRRDVDIVMCKALDKLVKENDSHNQVPQSPLPSSIVYTHVRSSTATEADEATGATRGSLKSPRRRHSVGTRGTSINNSGRDRVFAGSERAASALLFKSNSALLKHIAKPKSGGPEFWRCSLSESGEIPPVLAMIRRSGGVVTHELAHIGKVAGDHAKHVGETVAHEISHGILTVVHAGDVVTHELAHFGKVAGDHAKHAGDAVVAAGDKVVDSFVTAGGVVIHGLSDAGKAAVGTVSSEFDNLVHKTEVTTKMASKLAHIASKGKHGLSSIGKAAATKGQMASNLFVGAYLGIDSFARHSVGSLASPEGTPGIGRSGLASPLSPSRRLRIPSPTSSPLSAAGADILEVDDIFANLNSLHPGERLLSARDDSHHVHTFVLKGASGSGKSTSAFYFKRAAVQRGLKCFWVTCRSESDNVSYGVLREIFMELIGGKQEFVTELQQRAVLAKLLDLVYQDRLSIAMLERKMDLLVNILGLEWTDLRESAEDEADTQQQQEAPEDSMDVDGTGKDLQAFAIASRKRLQGRTGQTGRLFQRICSFHEDDVFRDVLTYLFQQSPCAMVIEKAHFCDAVSWKVLKTIQDMPIQLVLLITVQMHLRDSGEKTPHSSSLATKLGSKRFTKGKTDLLGRASNGLFNQESIVENIESLAQDGACEVLELLPFTRDEVGLLLQSMLDTPDTLEKLGSFAMGSNKNLLTPPLVTPRTMSPVGKVDSTSQVVDVETALAIITSEADTLGEEYIQSVRSDYFDTPAKPQAAISVVTEEMKDFVTSSCAGNPFWCKLMARFIQDHGVDMFTKSMTNSDFAMVSDSQSDRLMADNEMRSNSDKNPLSSLIINRLESLKNTDQVILKYASILSVSPDFKLELLCDILPERFFPGGDVVAIVKEALHIAMGQGLVVYVSHNPPTYAFSNELIRKTLYRCTPISDARKLHVVIAKKIMSLHANDLRPHYESLSDHYTVASLGASASIALSSSERSRWDLRVLALEFSVKASDQALRYGGYDHVLFYLQRAHKLAKFPLEFQVCADIIEIALEEIAANPHEQDISPALVDTFHQMLERVRNRSNSNFSMSAESMDEFSFSHRLSSPGEGGAEASARASLSWQPSFTMSKQTSRDGSSTPANPVPVLVRSPTQENPSSGAEASACSGCCTIA